MGFNEKLYHEYLYSAGVQTKDENGWNVTRFPNGLYCFATNQWLGDNGEIDDYHLLGKTLRHKKTGKKYLVETACIHYHRGGYHYYITCGSYPLENKSGTAFYSENINCTDEETLRWIASFNKEFEVLD